MPNAVDREFVRLTIPHHQQGVQMAALAVERASNHEVKRVAEHTLADQRKEIGELEQHLSAVGLSAGDLAPPEAKATAMKRMLDHLRQQPGHMFDASFLAMMMNHHAGALGVAELEASGGEHPDLVTMARSTHDKQLKELAEMSEMLAAVSNQGMMNKVKNALT